MRHAFLGIVQIICANVPWVLSLTKINVRANIARILVNPLVAALHATLLHSSIPPNRPPTGVHSAVGNLHGGRCGGTVPANSAYWWGGTV